MNAKEQRIYRLELKLIKAHFKGVRPRPIKLVKKLELGADGEAGEPDLLLRDRKRPRKELEDLLKHELIHYQLKDRGKVYHGHGSAFLKRAQALGIANEYVLQRCFSPEEFEHTPTVRTAKKVPLRRFKRQVDQWFNELLGQTLKLPAPHNARLYPYVQNTYVGWAAFSAAVKDNSDHVIQEIWRVKKGLRGKGLHELQQEYLTLHHRRGNLEKKRRRGDRSVAQQLKLLDRALARIRTKLKQDYGILVD